MRLARRLELVILNVVVSAQEQPLRSCAIQLHIFVDPADGS